MLQVQERLTKQVAQAMQEALCPYGVGVVIEAKHMCMVMRGVQKNQSSTITSCMLGEFKNNKKNSSRISFTHQMWSVHLFDSLILFFYGVVENSERLKFCH